MTIAAPDMVTITEELTVGDSSIDDTVTGIPAGDNREFTVEIFDSAGIVRYSGSATASVLADTVVRVAITIRRTTGDVVIDLVIEEPAPVVSVDGLVAYYPFNGDANDESGNGNDAQIVGASLTIDRHGQAARAMELSGQGDHLAIPPLDLQSSFTVSFWLQTTAQGPGSFPWYVFIVDRDICSFYDDWSLGIDSDGKLQFHVGKADGSLIVSADSVNDGVWHHVAIVHNSGLVENSIFIDGALAATGQFGPATFVNEEYPVLLGQSNCNPSTHVNYDGLIDDVRIYNLPFSSDSVAALYQREKPAGIPTAGMLAYFPFDGDANDASGNGNHADQIGATFAADRSGQPGKAVSLDGHGDYLSIPPLDMRSSFSVSFWMKSTGRGAGAFPWYMFIVDRDICNFYDDWSLGIDAYGRLQFHVGKADGSLITSADTVNNDTWRHVAIVHDSASTRNSIYIDGALSATAQFGPATFVNDAYPVLLGQSNCKPTTHVNYDGLIDEVRIYGVSLSGDDVQALYLHEKP